MDQNSAHASFNMDYTPMRKPHLDRGDKPNTPPSVRSVTSSVLSPNARVFVPQNKQTITEAFNNLSINSSVPVIQQPQQTAQQQQHQYHQHHHHQYHHNLNFDQVQQLQQNCISSLPQQQPQQQYFNQYQHKSNKFPLQDRIRSNQQHPSSQQYNQQMQQQNIQSLRTKPGSVQNRLIHNSSNDNVEHQHHQQRQQHQQPYYNHQQPRQGSSSSVVNNSESSQNQLPEQTGDETFALSFLEETVECLSSDPGSFDSIAPRALNVFRGFGENQYVLSNAMEIIFNQSIEEPNFRYMGAKLYGLFDSINPKKDSMFRNLLNLKLDYHRNEVINYMQNENAKVRGTTLFLAELYMQLRNNGSRIPEIAQNIIFTMKQLLQKHTPENIKCICLTLKLAGYDLEIDCPTDLLYIIDNLRQLKMDVSTSRLLENTLSLHKNNWGRNESITTPTQYSNNTIQFSNEPVFYGPDGQVLTEEENSFLEANIPSDIINDDDPDFDEFDLETGMDPEMEKDYNEFLKNTLNHSC